MSITKLQASAEGTAGNSTGADVATAVNALIDRGTPFAKAFNLRMLQGAVPSVISVQGDSTANDVNEWFYLLMQDIHTKFPAYEVIQYLWSIPNDSFMPPTTVGAGSSGSGYVELSKGNDTFGTVTNDTNNMDTPAALDVRVKFSIDDYANNGEGLLLSKFGAAGNRSWALGLYSSGTPYLWWSEDGTVLSSPTTATAALPTAGTVIYLRATIDSATDELIFYTSSDEGDTWDQLGSTVTVSLTGIFNSTADLHINGRGTAQWNGKFYHGEVLDGIDGAMVASPNAALYRLTEEFQAMKDINGNDFTFSAGVTDYQGSPTLFALNASASGKPLGYSLNTARFAKQTPMKTDFSFVSYSHNDGGTSDYYNNYETFIDWHVTKYKNALVVPVTQNPKKSPSSAEHTLEHAHRCGVIAQIAASKGLDFVDAYGDFLLTGDPDALVDVDGIHPNAAGSILWKDAAAKVLGV